MYRSTGIYTRRGEKTPIRFGSYNIKNIKNRGLRLVIQGMSQAKLDLGIFQETNITDRVYTPRSAGYSVVATDTLIPHRGRVAVFYQASLRFAVEAIQKFGPNFFSLHLAAGERRWYIIGCYLAPDDASAVESVVADLRERPQG